MASSDRKVYSTLVNRTRWAESGSKLTTRVEKRSLKSYLCNRQRVFFFFFLSFPFWKTGFQEYAMAQRLRVCAQEVKRRLKAHQTRLGRTTRRTFVNGRSSSVMRNKREDV